MRSAIFIIGTLGFVFGISAFLSCKPRRSDSSTKGNGNSLCPHSPDPRQYVLSELPSPYPKLKLGGFVDAKSLQLAKYLLNTVSNPTGVTDGKVILVQASELYQGSKDIGWVLVAAGESLLIFQKTKSGAYQLKFRFDDLIVNDMFVAYDGSSVGMVTGENSNEFVVINLQELKVPMIEGRDFDVIRKDFVQTRDREVKLRGNTHDYTFTRGMDLRKFDRFLKYIGFNVGSENTKQGLRDFANIWRVANRVLYANYFNNADDFASNRITAMTSPPLAGAKSVQQYFVGRSNCQKGMAGNISGCAEVAISWHSEENSQGPSEKIVYRKSAGNSESGVPEITMIAASQNPNFRKLAIADVKGVHILTEDADHGFRIKKSFLTNEKVVGLHFYESAPNDPFNADNLMVASEDSSGEIRYRLIDLRLAMGPVTIGGHANGDGYGNDWRYKQYYSQLSEFKNLDRKDRASHWGKAPGNDSQAVYAAQFTPDCQSVLTGGSDGMIRRWDLRNLESIKNGGFRELPSQVIGGGPAHQHRVQALAYSEQANLLLSGGSDGLAKLWEVGLSNGSSNVMPAVTLKDQFPKAQAPASDGETPVVEKYASVNVVAFSPNQDAVLLAVKNIEGQSLTSPLQIFTISGEVKYQGINDRAARAFLDANGNSNGISGIAPFPGSQSPLGRVLNSRYANDPDVQSLYNSIALASMKGGLIATNILVGGSLQQFMTPKFNGAPYLDLKTTEQGQWILGARGDGLIERFYNNAIDRNSLSIPDTRCWGSADLQNAYKQKIIQSGVRQEAVGYRYLNHKGPVLGIAPIALQHSSDANIENMNGLVSVGFDGTLVTWNLLDSCKALNAANPPENAWYDNKLRNVSYSNHFLSSLSVSKDHNYAATGTIDGKVLLWWIGEELSID